MKKLTAILAGMALLTSVFTASADNDRPITVGELPSAAQHFLKKHFNHAAVSYAKVDQGVLSKEYKVVFTDGTSVEFAKDGEWTEVDAERGAVPASVVPKQIADEVAKRFAGQGIETIERNKRGYEVSLQNGLDLMFDRSFKLVRVDD